MTTARLTSTVGARMRRGLRIAAAVSVVVLAAAFAPKKADDPGVIFAKVGDALEAHGVTPCETPDWNARVDSYDRARRFSYP